jgi:2-C-methyl-D-erythritol 4-phosphate cytidylyltransferase
MGGPTPKQFALVGGRPALALSVERFYGWDPEVEIIITLPQDTREYWTGLCTTFGFNVPHRVVNGGQTRFHSVKNALATITDVDALVAIHDAARPFVSREVISDCFDAAGDYGAAVPVIDLADSIRERENDWGRSRAVDRRKFVAAQTPQAFRLGLLRMGYAQEYREEFTDDASVVEALGAEVVMVKGSAENIKLTSPLDLQIAELILKRSNL